MTTEIKRPMCGECVFYRDLYCFHGKPVRAQELGGFHDDGEVQVEPTRVACREWFPLSGRMRQLALAFAERDAWPVEALFEREG